MAASGSLLLVMLLLVAPAPTHAADLYCGDKNCYEVIGLANPLGLADDEMPTERDIKKAYRKMSMLYHPDKCSGEKEECEGKFIELANANEVLSDESKRSDYDYALEHPDAVFYNNMVMYRHTYAEKTDVRYVLLFIILAASVLQFSSQHSTYEHLVQLIIDHPNFKSTIRKELKDADAEAIKLAWRERAVQQLADSQPDAVPSLLRTPMVALVFLPYTLTIWVKGIPERRAAAVAAADVAAELAATKAAAEEASEAAMAERKAAREAAVAAMKAADDAREKVWADKKGAVVAKEEAKQKSERNAREQEKQAAKAARKALRKLCEGNTAVAADETLALEGVEFACSMADARTLSVLVAAMEREGGDEAAACSLLAAKVKSLEEAAVAEARRRSAEAAAREKKQLAEQAVKAEFSEDELRLLTQALKKFPGGTLNRFEKIAEHVSQLSGTLRTATEVGNQTKKLHPGSWKAGNVDAGAIQRAAAAAALAKKSAATGAALSDAARLGAAAAAAVADGPAPKPWSEVEQRALEVGLKEFPSSLKDERWVIIAGSGLQGRTPQECKKRFKVLAKALKEKKAGKTS